MKRIRRGLAVTLAALLMIPAQPTLAVPSGSDGEQKEWKEDSLATPSDLENGSFGDEIPDEDELWKDVVEDNDLQKGETPDEDEDLKDKEIPEEDGEIPEEDDVASPSDLEKTPEEEIRFNTGNHEVSVVSYEDFFDRELGDAYFEEDGSYTIQIPEENPFFPYEVQFTSGGTVTKEWFMTPEDSVEIDDHIFYVSAFFDDTVVTQMTLDVAGDTVVVYPEAKEFTDGDGISPLSLLPLEERSLSVDLSGYTPVELTMVSIDSIFAGNENLAGKSVMWSLEGEDDYIINHAGDKIDMSVDPWTDSALWEMIVGEESQLADGNIRYLLDMTVTSSEDWLVPTVYEESNGGKRTEISVLNSSYNLYNIGPHHDRERYLEIEISENDLQDPDQEVYVNLDINKDIFGTVQYKDIKFFLGSSEGGEDITDQILGNVDMTQSGAGYPIGVDSDYTDITAVTYDKDGNITGRVQFWIELRTRGNGMSMGLYEKTDTGRVTVYDGTSIKRENGVNYWVWTLKYGYPVDGDYYLRLTYHREDTSASSYVTAAYAGLYNTIAQAQAAGVADIKDTLFGDGYKANYSAGVPITVFVGEDGSADQEIYRYVFQTEEGEQKLDSSVSFWINDLCDANGTSLANNSYIVEEREDSYAEYNYRTIFVDETVDLEHLTLSFQIPTKAELYAEGSGEPVISEKTVLDFSDGPVQFTVSAENKKNSKNYWIQVIQIPDAGTTGALYFNSQMDENAETTREDGVIYSTREIFIDSRHDSVHDILIANIGSEELSDLTVELESDTDAVVLDSYWTLNGGYGLGGFTTVKDSGHGELPNLAKIRLLAQKDAEGQDVSGTLTIKSGGELLAVLTLTGVVGDPMITTKEIPEAVKYVPYGTMIQNSNKYDWNTVSYRLLRGNLPSGMVVKENGELYGVPTESGEFTFTVRMDNSESEFGSHSRTYTLIVKENTDINVNASTDPGYEVTQRIPDITLASTEDHTFVSQGLYGQFVDVFLDGVKLVEGQDYDSESGSTRITIRSQTLKASNQTGTHTLGVEFRTEDRTLKRAAQNYRVTGSGSSGGGGGGGSVTVSTGNGSLTRDAKKGYVNSITGIVTGEGEGYSKWQQDETGWRLIYADGTAAAGYMAEQTDGNSVEQVLWEKVNGSWYAFGANGYLKSGWVWDYELAAWYSLSVDSGMRSSWYTDTQDGCTYYMDPSTGKMVIGWKLIDGKWYYFNETTPVQTWFYNAESGAWVYNVNSGARPFGSMYQNEWTPDHYHVGVDGAWEE